MSLSGLTAVESNMISCENLTSLLYGRNDRGATNAKVEQNGFKKGNDHKKGSCYTAEINHTTYAEIK